ncbi:hypothetical protein CALVIDRAFT_303256 [Calocera viscosa TUFC12733]|uniref:Uncharacterized protein n=1 Tax=Calocera viscosa (strain TUFC12733) TaxID=1330018 RepID=A0A167IEV7_CALVF|nr:hypothetical protein CALVIDRAFT_303256 [Calocera viscosa TUFC12733]
MARDTPPRATGPTDRDGTRSSHQCPPAPGDSNPNHVSLPRAIHPPGSGSSTASYLPLIPTPGRPTPISVQRISNSATHHSFQQHSQCPAQPLAYFTKLAPAPRARAHTTQRMAPVTAHMHRLRLHTASRRGLRHIITTCQPQFHWQPDDLGTKPPLAFLLGSSTGRLLLSPLSFPRLFSTGGIPARQTSHNPCRAPHPLSPPQAANIRSRPVGPFSAGRQDPISYPMI